MKAATSLRIIAAGSALLATLVAGPAAAKDNEATTALSEFRGKRVPKDVIQNKFFTKANRFEVAPLVGYIPSNAFVDNWEFGGVLAYHFSETLAAEGDFLFNPFNPDVGVKNLTKTLLAIAYDDKASDFQQPIDTVGYAVMFSARWAPVYGKINLVGESVLNFDVYGTAGIGIVGISNNYGRINEEYNGSTVDPDTGEQINPVAPITPAPAEPPSPIPLAFNLGFGLNFFLAQGVALKLDARTINYVAPGPDYDAGDNTSPPDQFHSEFVTTAGISIFVPKMKSRTFNF
jgi:outer membrane beta-barrel protein